MLTPSSGTLADYNAAVLNGNTVSARLVFPVQNITLDGNDISADGGIQLTSILNPDTDLQMGKAISTEVVCHLLNSNVFSGFDWTEEFHLDFGVDINGTTNWVTVGYFTGEKPEKVLHTDVIEFTAYDRMRKFDMLADDFISSLTFPMTMAQIYSALCTYVGITSAVGNEMADSMALSFSESPFISGMTLRSILSAIAEANGCYAKITADGKVKLVWFSDQTSNYSVDGDDYFTISVDENDAPVPDYIRVGCTYDDSISGFVYPVGGSGECYQILDNPFLLNASSADLTTVLTNILARFASFGNYFPMGVNIVGNWMVEVGDIIEVDIDNSTFAMPIFSRMLTFDGGCNDGYECTGKASRTEVSESAKEQYETGGKLANKYTVKSGVDITDEGVTISGGKFLKLISGGVLDVQSQNFTIDSEAGTVSSGNWMFDENGLSLVKTFKDQNDNDHILAFALGDATRPAEAETMGYIHFNGIDGFYGVLPSIEVGFDRATGYGFNPAHFKIQQFADNTISIFPNDGDNLMLGFPSYGNAPGSPDLRIKYGYFQNIGNSLDQTPYGFFQNLGGACNQMYDTVTSGAITWESSAVTTANSSYTLYKWGKLVFLRVTVYIKNAITSFTKIATLASAYRPAANAYIVATTLNASSTHQNFIQIQPNGNMRMSKANDSSSEATTYCGTVMFFTE